MLPNLSLSEVNARLGLMEPEWEKREARQSARLLTRLIAVAVQHQDLTAVYRLRHARQHVYHAAGMQAPMVYRPVMLMA